MNHLKLSLGLACLLVATTGFAQMQNFDLSTYKLNDYKRQGLDIVMDLNGSHNNSELVNENDKNKYAHNNYYGDVTFRYFLQQNQVKLQQGIYTGIALNPNYSGYKSDDYESSNFSSSPNLYFNSYNRFYKDYGSFFEFDSYFNVSYFNQTYKSKNGNSESDTKSEGQSISAIIPLKYGFGRIEQVQDARHAIYIFDELTKVGRIKTNITDADIIEFATLISELKNQRVLDARLKRIAELESVDSFMLARNYISERDARYFATLTDIWDFGNAPNRNAGHRFSLAIIPGYEFLNYYEDYDNYYGINEYQEMKLNYYSVMAGIEYIWEKPINLEWQNTINTSTYLSYNQATATSNLSEGKDKLRTPNYQLNFYESIGYYPNTRTDLSLGYFLQYRQVFDKPDSDEIATLPGKGVNTGLELKINYYISPKLRFYINSGTSYLWQKGDFLTNFDFDSQYNGFALNLDPTINNYTRINKDYLLNFKIGMIYSIF